MDSKKPASRTGFFIGSQTHIDANNLGNLMTAQTEKVIKNLKIDVLLPDTSFYDVLHHFSRKFFEALQRTGCSCRLLEGNQRYLLPLESPPDFTLGFNGALKIEGEKLFCDFIEVKHIACLVDSPFRFMELFSSPNVLLTCDDEYCCEDLKANFFSNTFFLPQAVEKELAGQVEVEKIYDVVMLATFVDCEKRKKEWKDKFPAHIRQGMEEAVAITLNDEKTSYIAALKQTLNLYINNNIEAAMLKAIVSEVELYIKGRDKLDLLRSITDCEVHVFGNSIDLIGWKEVCQNQSNIIVHPAVPFLEALEIMKRSKILLNSSIKNKQGAHERIFSGSAAGAVVVTNDNIYMRQHFEDEKEIILYRRAGLDTLNDRIHLLLDNEQRRLEISRQARAKVMNHHTWDHRVAQLLKILFKGKKEERT
jgi:glycosyltransferase involved in cell wall biosynthesis